MVPRLLFTTPRSLRSSIRRTTTIPRQSIATMSTSGRSTPAGSASEKNGKNSNKREIKILMLHGYTQSGPLFRAKTRALEKLLQKTLGPFGLSVTMFYPTAPNRLRPSDIPGYEPPNGDGDEAAAETETDAWAWYRKDEASGAYRLLSEGMDAIASAVTEAGGIDGVIGFSQGGATSAMVAAATELPARPVPVLAADSSWAARLREANGGRPLRFAVIYSGFWAPPAELQWLYDPPVRTPTLHFIGSLDTVVDESRSRALVDRCVDPVVVVHPGGHYVPVGKEWVMPLAGFIKKHCENANAADGPTTTGE